MWLVPRVTDVYWEGRAVLADLMCTLGQLVDESGLGLRLMRRTTRGAQVGVSRAELVTGPASVPVLDVAPVGHGVPLLVPLPPAGVDPDAPVPQTDTYAATVEAIMRADGDAAVAVWLTDAIDEAWVLHASQGRPVVIVPSGVRPEEIIAAIARSAAAGDDALTRRLTTLQRTLTQALATSRPLDALVQRLGKMCNATTAIVGASGQAEHTTGPLPLALLTAELDRTPVDSRPFEIEGWYGFGVRVSLTAESSDKTGWLLLATPRSSFPDVQATAAAHVAASLVETAVHIDVLSQRQDRSVRSSLLEQVLSMRLERHDAELSGRVAALGFDFEQGLRCVVWQLAAGGSRRQRAGSVEDLYSLVHAELQSRNIAHLVAVRERSVVALIQATAATIRRALPAAETSRFLTGIGRDARSLGEAVDSFNDAELSLRVLHQRPTTARVMAYEDFDFATRLFADTGVERMARWAGELLGPLADQPILLEGLRHYFDSNLNVIEAAKGLNVHQNSLRYRLTKVEQTLQMSLRDPAAISSLYLALTAQSMADARNQVLPRPGGAERPAASGSVAKASDATNAVKSEYPSGPRNRLGAAIGPER